MAIDENAKLTKPVSEQDHIRGPEDASVNLVEYGDYECPHCREVNDIRRELRARLGDKYRYVYRHFPITKAHTNAQLAAEAAEAARDAASGSISIYMVSWWIIDVLIAFGVYLWAKKRLG